MICKDRERIETPAKKEGDAPEVSYAKGNSFSFDGSKLTASQKKTVKEFADLCMELNPSVGAA